MRREEINMARTKKTAPATQYATREEWLVAATNDLRPRFTAAGSPIPDVVRLSVGWPKGKRGPRNARVLGECYPPSASADLTRAIFITPEIADAPTVLSTLVHELAHAALPAGTGHKRPFAALATALGLVGKPTSTTAGEDLAADLAELATRLGEYPHAVMTMVGVKKQGTRMLKVECGECGCILRMTAKWIEEAGIPTCGCGGSMHDEAGNEGAARFDGRIEDEEE